MASPARPPPPPDPRRARGAHAEAVAARALERRGYQILERNFRCRIGELDLIADDGGIVVFVEVRCRSASAHGRAVEQVGPAKQRQVTRVAEVYLVARGLSARRCRFDVVGITGDVVEVIRDAWRPGLP